MDDNNSIDIDGFKFPHIEVPNIPTIDYSELPTNFMWSDTQFEIIKKYISDFEEKLDNNHEVALMLTNFGQSVIMNVTDIGYDKSVLMIFKGYVNEQKATLIQHINQLNFLLIASPRTNMEKPKKRIGFNLIDNKGN